MEKNNNNIFSKELIVASGYNLKQIFGAKLS